MSNALVQNALSDPSTSNWLRSALESALPRDPVDAANDAERLAQILASRADAQLSAGNPQST